MVESVSPAARPHQSGSGPVVDRDEASPSARSWVPTCVMERVTLTSHEVLGTEERSAVVEVISLEEELKDT